MVSVKLSHQKIGICKWMNDADQLPAGALLAEPLEPPS